MHNLLNTIRNIPGAIQEHSMGAQKALGLDVGKAFKDSTRTYGEIRKAGAIFNAHPAGALIQELVFPQPAAGGELTEALQRFGPDAVNRNPNSTYDPTL